jgi:aminoglycoside phosphotransferase (APT) family kinase protein
VDVVGDWLEAHRPQPFKTGILHGDYHLSNVMFRCDSAELAAIVDWELATIGDPLMDLGGLLATWPEPDGVQRPGIVGTAPWDGFPTAPELIERYEGVIGRKVDSVEWYGVLGCYKLGILLEGTYARACAGKASVETGERLHAAAQALFGRAMNWVNGGMRR